MTSPEPYYTATAGPADPKAPFIQKVYAIVASLGVLIGGAATFNVITADQAASLTGVGTALTTLVVSGATAVAAFRTKKQIKNGTFDAAPQLPAYTALEQIAILRDQVVREDEDARATAQAGADVIQAVASNVAKSLGVPSVVTDLGNAGIDGLQELLSRTQGRV